MAYLKQPKRAKREEDLAQTGQQPVSSVAPTAAPPVDLSSPQRGAPTPESRRQSGTFTGFQKYVKANVGQAEPLAGKLGAASQAQAQGVTEDIARAKKQYDTAAEQAEQQAFGDEDRATIERYFSNPSYRVPTTEEAQRVGELAETTYAGPTGVATDEIEARGTRAAERAKQLESEPGRRIQLQETFGRPTYQSGQQRLDLSILQSDRPALEGLQQTSRQIQERMPQESQAFKQGISSDVQTRQQAVEELRRSLLARAGITPEQKPVASPEANVIAPELAPEAKGKVTRKAPIDGNKYVETDIMAQINESFPDNPLNDTVEVRDEQGNLLYRGSSSVVNTIKRFGVDPINYFQQRAEFLDINPIIEPSRATIQREQQTIYDERKNEIAQQVEQEFPAIAQQHEQELGRALTDQERQDLFRATVDQRVQAADAQRQQQLQTNLQNYQTNVTKLAQEEFNVNMLGNYIQELNQMLQEHQGKPRNVFTEAEYQNTLSQIMSELNNANQQLQQAQGLHETTFAQQSQLEKDIRADQKYYNLGQFQPGQFEQGTLPEFQPPEYRISKFSDYLDRTLRALNIDPASITAGEGQNLQDAASAQLKGKLQNIFDNFGNLSGTEQQVLKDAYDRGLLKITDGQVAFRSAEEIQENLADPRLAGPKNDLDSANVALAKGNYYVDLANKLRNGQFGTAQMQVGNTSVTGYKLPDGLTIAALMDQGFRFSPELELMRDSTSIPADAINAITSGGNTMIQNAQSKAQAAQEQIDAFKANPPAPETAPAQQGIQSIVNKVNQRVQNIKKDMKDTTFNIKRALASQGTSKTNIQDAELFKSLMGRDLKPGENMNLYGLNLSNYIKQPEMLDDQQLFYGAMNPEEFEEIKNISTTFKINNPYQNTGGYGLGNFKPGIIFDADAFRRDAQAQTETARNLIQKDYTEPTEKQGVIPHIMRHGGFDTPKSVQDTMLLMSGIGKSRFGPNTGMGADQILNTERTLNAPWALDALNKADEALQRTVAEVNSLMQLNLDINKMYKDAYQKLYKKDNVYDAGKQVLIDTANSERQRRTTPKGGWVLAPNYMDIINSNVRTTDWFAMPHVYRTSVAKARSNAILEVLDQIKKLSSSASLNLPNAGQRTINYANQAFGQQPQVVSQGPGALQPISGFEAGPDQIIDNGDGTFTRRIF